MYSRSAKENSVTATCSKNQLVGQNLIPNFGWSVCQRNSDMILASCTLIIRLGACTEVDELVP